MQPAPHPSLRQRNQDASSTCTSSANASTTNASSTSASGTCSTNASSTCTSSPSSTGRSGPAEAPEYPEVRERLSAVGAIAQAISAEVQKVIIGKAHIIDNVLINILSNGNLLFEDYPGLAKTLMTNTFADALGCDFKRVQFTPDLLPADITGTNVYDAKKENLPSSQVLYL